MKLHAVVSSGILTGLLLASTLATRADLITFQVNMGAQIAMGRFNPDTMNVECRGGFQSPVQWTGGFLLTNSVEQPEVYVGTYNVTNTVAPNFIQYKFTYNNGTYEPRTGLGNRFVGLTGSPQTLPVVYYDDLTNAITNSVTFQVDMTSRIGQGTFDPNFDYVTVAGPFALTEGGQWDATAAVLDPIGNNIYAGTYDVVDGLGRSVAYKFTINGGGVWEGNVGPDNGNRVFVLTNDPTPLVLPVVNFNNLAGILFTNQVTFLLNMSYQTALGSNFIQGLDTVSVAGDFQNPAWSPASGLLTDSGTNVYYGTFDAIGSSNVATTVSFQYVINGLTWENDLYATGNRQFTFTANSNTNQTLAMAFYGNVNNLGQVTITPVGGDQVSLSWSPGTNIRLQSRTNFAAGDWEDVPDTEGESAKTVTTDGTTFYRVTGP
ncbi:MAG TPA: hypothetical protein PKA41_13515 [Verrucomicrobiota bacterium]|nr:hypothetical protein [Verrucomicrobiota bacterium]